MPEQVSGEGGYVGVFVGVGVCGAEYRDVVGRRVAGCPVVGCAVAVGGGVEGCPVDGRAVGGGVEGCPVDGSAVEGRVVRGPEKEGRGTVTIGGRVEGVGVGRDVEGLGDITTPGAAASDSVATKPAS